MIYSFARHSPSLRLYATKEIVIQPVLTSFFQAIHIVRHCCIIAFGLSFSRPRWRWSGRSPGQKARGVWLPRQRAVAARHLSAFESSLWTIFGVNASNA